MFFRLINGIRALLLGIFLLLSLASFGTVGVQWWNVAGVIGFGYYTLSNAFAALGRSGEKIPARPSAVPAPAVGPEQAVVIAPAVQIPVAVGPVAREGDVPAGWYWAPFDSAAARRWWDGTTWTERTDPQTSEGAGVDLSTAEPPVLKSR
jgi:hypothetical protein